MVIWRPYHPSHTTPRWHGPLSINMEGMVPDAKVFFIWQIQTITVHVHNTFCCMLYSTWPIEPKLGILCHWHMTNICHIPYFWSQMCMHSLNLLHAQFFSVQCDIYLSTQVSYPIYHVWAHLPKCFPRYRKSVACWNCWNCILLEKHNSGPYLTCAEHWGVGTVTLPTQFVLN